MADIEILPPITGSQEPVDKPKPKPQTQAIIAPITDESQILAPITDEVQLAPITDESQLTQAQIDEHNRRVRLFQTGTPFQLAERKKLQVQSAPATNFQARMRRAEFMNPEDLPSETELALYGAKYAISSQLAGLPALGAIAGLASAGVSAPGVVVGAALQLPQLYDTIRHGSFDTVKGALDDPAKFESLYAMTVGEETGAAHAATSPSMGDAFIPGMTGATSREQFRTQLQTRLAEMTMARAGVVDMNADYDRQIAASEGVGDGSLHTALVTAKKLHNILDVQPATTVGEAFANVARGGVQFTGPGFSWLVLSSAHDAQIALSRNDLTGYEQSTRVLDALNNASMKMLGLYSEHRVGVINERQAEAEFRTRSDISITIDAHLTQAREIQKQAESLSREYDARVAAAAPMVDRPRLVGVTPRSELRARLGATAEAIPTETPSVEVPRVTIRANYTPTTSAPTSVPSPIIEPSPESARMATEARAPIVANVNARMETQTPNTVLIVPTSDIAPQHLAKPGTVVNIPDRNISLIFHADAHPRLVAEARDNNGYYSGSRVSYNGMDYVVDMVNADKTVDLVSTDAPNHHITIPTSHPFVPSAGENGAALVTYKGQPYYIRGYTETKFTLERPGKPPLVVNRENTTHIPGTQESVVADNNSMRTRLKQLMAEYVAGPRDFVRRRLGIDLPQATTQAPAMTGKESHAVFADRTTEELTTELTRHIVQHTSDHTAITNLYNELMIRKGNHADVVKDVIDLYHAIRAKGEFNPSWEISRLFVESDIGTAKMLSRASTIFTTDRFPNSDAVYTALAQELGLTNVEGLKRHLTSLEDKENRHLYLSEEEQIELARMRKDQVTFTGHVVPEEGPEVPVSLHANRNGMTMDVDLDGSILLRDAHTNDVIARVPHDKNALDVINSIAQARLVNSEPVTAENNVGSEVPAIFPEITQSPTGIVSPSSAINQGNNGGANGGKAFDGLQDIAKNNDNLITRLMSLLGGKNTPYTEIKRSQMERYDRRTGYITHFGELVQRAVQAQQQGANEAAAFMKDLGLEAINKLRKGIPYERVKLHGQALYTRSAEQLAQLFKMTPHELETSKWIQDAIAAAPEHTDMNKVFKAVIRQILLNEHASNWSDADRQELTKLFANSVSFNIKSAEPAIFTELLMRQNNIDVTHDAAKTNAATSKQPEPVKPLFRTDLIARHAVSVMNDTPGPVKFMAMHRFSPKEQSIVSQMHVALTEIGKKFSLQPEEIYKFLNIDMFARANNDAIPGEVHSIMQAHERTKPSIHELSPTYNDIWHTFTETGEHNPYEADALLTLSRLARAAIQVKTVRPELARIQDAFAAQLNSVQDANLRGAIQKDILDFMPAVRGSPDATWETLNAGLARNLLAQGIITKEEFAQGKNGRLVSSIANTMMSFTTLNYQAARPAQGLRDVANFTSWATTLFSGKLARAVLLEAFSKSPSEISALSRELRIGGTGVSPLMMDLTSANIDDPRFKKNFVQSSWRKISNAGMKASLQEGFYERISIGMYLHSREIALREFNKVLSSNEGFTRERLQRLHLDKLDPALAQSLDRMLASKNGSEAADYYARYMITKVLPPYGFGNAPRHWSGNTGRMFTRLGFYAAFTISNLNDIARYGSLQTRAWRMSKLLVNEGVLFAADKFTGYNLTSYMLTPGLSFSGSPLLAEVIRAQARPHEKVIDRAWDVAKTALPFGKLVRELTPNNQAPAGSLDYWLRSLLSLNKNKPN